MVLPGAFWHKMMRTLLKVPYYLTPLYLVNDKWTWSKGDKFENKNYLLINMIGKTVCNTMLIPIYAAHHLISALADPSGLGWGCRWGGEKIILGSTFLSLHTFYFRITCNFLCGGGGLAIWPIIGLAIPLRGWHCPVGNPVSATDQYMRQQMYSFPNVCGFLQKVQNRIWFW